MSDYVITDQTGRIDKVLTALEPGITRSQLKNLINDGHVTVNGQAVKPKYKVHAGDKISLVKPEPQSLELTPENIPLDIVWFILLPGIRITRWSMRCYTIRRYQRSTEPSARESFTGSIRIRLAY